MNSLGGRVTRLPSERFSLPSCLLNTLCFDAFYSLSGPCSQCRLTAQCRALQSAEELAVPNYCTAVPSGDFEYTGEADQVQEPLLHLPYLYIGGVLGR